MSIVFHVGFPKAASTTFQNQLFAQHSDLINLGIYSTDNVGTMTHTSEPLNAPILNDFRIQRLHRSLTEDDGILFDQNAAKELFSQLLHEYRSSNSTVILSNEYITSGRFSNPEIIEKGRRIHSICPEAKILIIIRSQVDMLKALYRDHPFDPRTLDFAYRRPVNFSNWLDIQFNLPYLSILNTLLFFRVLEKYELLFPKEQILMLPLELLKRDPDSFLIKVSEFLDIDHAETSSLLKNKHENMGISAFGNRYRKLRSQLMPFMKIFRPMRSLLTTVDKNLFEIVKTFGKTEKIIVPEQSLLKLYDKYACDNSKLAKKQNLPLKDLGYLVVDT